MSLLQEIYTEIERAGGQVHHLPMRSLQALCTPDGTIAVDFDRIQTSAHELVCLTHELGHLSTGGFYILGSSAQQIGRQEERANRWAICRLVPIDRLCKALCSGVDSLAELADMFEVTPEFMVLAIAYYRSAKAMLPEPTCE